VGHEKTRIIWASFLRPFLTLSEVWLRMPL
jgi:hypothetical protein